MMKVHAPESPLHALPQRSGNGRSGGGGDDVAFERALVGAERSAVRAVHERGARREDARSRTGPADVVSDDAVGSRLRAQAREPAVRCDPKAPSVALAGRREAAAEQGGAPREASAPREAVAPPEDDTAVASAREADDAAPGPRGAEAFDPRGALNGALGLAGCAAVPVAPSPARLASAALGAQGERASATDAHAPVAEVAPALVGRDDVTLRVLAQEDALGESPSDTLTESAEDSGAAGGEVGAPAPEGASDGGPTAPSGEAALAPDPAMAAGGAASERGDGEAASRGGSEEAAGSLGGTVDGAAHESARFGVVDPGRGSVVGPSVAVDGGLGVSAADAEVEIAPDAPTPALTLVPRRLVVGVSDRDGAWTMELQRNDAGLDVLLRGDARFASSVRGVERELRESLMASGTVVANVQVESQAQGGGRERPSHERHERSASRSDVAEDAPASPAVSSDAPAQRGFRVSRMA